MKYSRIQRTVGRIFAPNLHSRRQESLRGARPLDKVLSVATIGLGTLLAGSSVAPETTAKVVTPGIVEEIRDASEVSQPVAGALGALMVGLGVVGVAGVAQPGRRRRQEPGYVVDSGVSGILPVMMRVPDLPAGHGMVIERTLTGVYPVTTLAYNGGAVFVEAVKGTASVDAHVVK